MIKPASLSLILAASMVLAACDQRVPDNQEPDKQTDQEEAGPDAAETGAVSILRSEVTPPEEQAETFDTLEAVIGFPDGSDELDADGVAELEKVLASPQIKFDGPIILRAHSDSAGTDKANEDASEARGLAVAGWLVGQGIDEARIEVIVFGEQNPAKPNALPDGSPNEKGRAANRRVNIEIKVPSQETIAASESEEPSASGEASAAD